MQEQVEQVMAERHLTKHPESQYMTQPCERREIASHALEQRGHVINREISYERIVDNVIGVIEPDIGILQGRVINEQYRGGKQPNLYRGSLNDSAH